MPYQLPLSDGQALTVPTSWADVTLAQYVALLAPAEGDQRTAAELLLGLDAGGLNELAADDIPYLANLLEFASDPSPVLELLPSPGLPEVGTLPYGTLLMAQQHIQADPERPLLAYGSYLLALYRVQLTYGKYDEAKVAACLAALLASPVTECAGDMGHFIGGYRNWLNGTPRTKPTTSNLKTKSSTPAAKKSGKGSGRFSAWMRQLAAPS